MVYSDFVATYRLQLNAEFTFADAELAIPAIATLGVSHLYLSPIHTAMAGSTHGYDWVPPAHIHPALGGIAGFRSLRTAAAAAGMGIIIDIVPNHTGVEDPRQNIWWWDVLTHGNDSNYARFFDIDTDLGNGAQGKIALPMLGSLADLDALDIVESLTGEAELALYEHRFPLRPGTDLSSAQHAHAQQSYRLVAWDSGHIGYRRFFAVNGLAALRQEEPAVYAATHQVVRDLVADNLVDGVRVDHPDGLADPIGYLHHLRSDIGDERLLLIEKILADDEDLDPTLRVDGTTGYEALRLADGVFINAAAEQVFTDIHRRLVGHNADTAWLADAERHIKRNTVHTLFPAERDRLIRAIRRDVDATAISDEHLSAVIAEVVAQLGVYRADYPHLRDRLSRCFDAVAHAHPQWIPAVDVIRAATYGIGESGVRLAQVGGATTAKSVEDCLFYRIARLVSLAEVGGTPGDFGIPIATFHAECTRRAAQWPRAMTTSSTHDTKHSEDVRARISVLTWFGEDYEHIVEIMESASPPADALTGLFLLQNIIGTWPLYEPTHIPTSLRARMHAYADKAMREAGLITSWTSINDVAESAMHAWIDAVYDGPTGEAIAEHIDRRRDALMRMMIAHKAATLLMPGIPDIYQGTHNFDDSLVDPDNRRPVNFAVDQDDPKTSAIISALRTRRKYPAAFGPQSGYLPLPASDDAVVAFARTAPSGEPAVVVILERHDTPHSAHIDLPAGLWQTRDGNTHRASVAAADVLTDSPVAIVTRIELPG